jgi:hypothetical protein
MMRRMQDGNGDENGLEPMAEDSPSPGDTNDHPLQALHASADTPQQHEQQAAPGNPPAATRPQLSVEIPARDCLPEHRIQVCLCDWPRISCFLLRQTYVLLPIYTHPRSGLSSSVDASPS